MRTPRLLIAAVAVAVLALAVAACGDDDAAEPTTTAAAATTTTAAPGATAAATTTTAGVATTAGSGSEDYVTEVEVTADNTLFDVTEITAKAGVELTVTFVNIDAEADAPHNIHFRMGSEDFFTTPAEATSEDELVFTPSTAGTFTFFCDTHPDVMLGTFIVIP
jgi:plastocyanin